MAATGTVTGRVRDDLGEGLGGAEVTVQSVKGSASGTTEPSGNYSVREVQPGPCTVNVKLDGFGEEQRQAVVKPGQAISLNIMLKRSR